MRGILFVLFVLISTLGYTQEVAPDSLMLNNVMKDTVSIDSTQATELKIDLNTDTIFISQNDSIVEKIEANPIEEIQASSELVKDSMVMDSTNVEFKADSIADYLETDTVTKVLPDSLISLDQITYTSSKQLQDSLLRIYRDSLYFMRIDSNYFYNKHIVENIYTDTSTFINDTLRQAVSILNKYLLLQDVDKAIGYLNQWNERSKTPLDSISLLHRDSLQMAFTSLLNQIDQDSVIVSFFNSSNDSISLLLTKNYIDSTHIALFDDRNESASVWIKSNDGKSFRLTLEEGATIQRPRRKKTRTKEVEYNNTAPGLLSVKKINLILPMWKWGGTTELMFNQGYVSNWVEGGESSISGLSVTKLFTRYTYGKKSWENDLEYRYGLLRAGDQDIRKNDDKLEFTSNYGQLAFNKWHYSISLNFKSQIFKGYNYPNDSIPVSSFLAPGHLLFSLGLEYKGKKNFQLLISPLTSKFTIVRDTAKYDQTSYGLTENEKIRTELGAYVKGTYRINFNDRISLLNKINFFTNYVDNPQNIDIDWEVDLKMKVSDNITASINTHLIYDDDVDIILKRMVNGVEEEYATKKIQFKEMINVGFTFKF